MTGREWLRKRGLTIWTYEGDGWMRTHDCRVRRMLGWQPGTYDEQVARLCELGQEFQRHVGEALFGPLSAGAARLAGAVVYARDDR